MINKSDYICRDNFKGALKRNLWKKCTEILCLGLLRVYFFPKFESYIHSDKPDLIDKKRREGIEVCEAIKEKDAQAIGEYSRLINGDENHFNKSLQIIKENGFDYSCGVLSWGVREDKDFLQDFSIVISKKLKLIDGYLTNGIEKLGLVVYCEKSIIYDYSKEIVDVYNELVVGKRGFDFIYFVFCYGIYYYDVSKKELSITEIKKDEYDYIYLLARAITEEKIKFSDVEWTNLVIN